MTINATRKVGGNRGPVLFRERDLSRAVRGLTKAGVDIGLCKITKDGDIVIVPLSAMPTAEMQDDLDRELSDFEERHGKG